MTRPIFAKWVSNQNLNFSRRLTPIQKRKQRCLRKVKKRFFAISRRPTLPKPRDMYLKKKPSSRRVDWYPYQPKVGPNHPSRSILKKFPAWLPRTSPTTPSSSFRERPTKPNVVLEQDCYQDGSEKYFPDTTFSALYLNGLEIKAPKRLYKENIFGWNFTTMLPRLCQWNNNKF